MTSQPQERTKSLSYPSLLIRPINGLGALPQIARPPAGGNVRAILTVPNSTG